MAADQTRSLGGIRAATSDSSPVEPAQRVTSEPNASEGSILASLQRADLRAIEIEQLINQGGALKSRKVKLAVVKHPETPRHITLPLLRQLFTFDLMGVALAPIVPADIKHAAEDVLIQRLENISAGERLTLARRASGGVAGSLLFDGDFRVMRAALNNARLTEALVIKAINDAPQTSIFLEAVSHHGKWSVRQEVRIALLRCEKTPLDRILAFARELPASLVRDVLHASKLPPGTKRYLQAELNLSD
jgi:hypothetical protein